MSNVGQQGARHVTGTQGSRLMGPRGSLDRLSNRENGKYCPKSEASALMGGRHFHSHLNQSNPMGTPRFKGNGEVQCSQMLEKGDKEYLVNALRTIIAFYCCWDKVQTLQHSSKSPGLPM